MFKPMQYSYRLWIKNIKNITRNSGQFIINDKEVSTVMIQGIVISVKKYDSKYIYTVDDSTGIIECKLYYLDYNNLQVLVGDLIRVLGKISEYQGELSLKLVSPPLKLENFDEEIDWAVSLDKLWRFVYTAPACPESYNHVHKTLGKRKNVQELDVVKSIRNQGRDFMDYDELYRLSGDNNEIILNLVQAEFLVPLGDTKELSMCKYSISPRPYHPKELLECLFKEKSGPISLKEIQDLNWSGTIDRTTLVDTLNELMQENLIYEVSDNVYAYIQ